MPINPEKNFFEPPKSDHEKDYSKEAVEKAFDFKYPHHERRKYSGKDSDQEIYQEVKTDIVNADHRGLQSELENRELHQLVQMLKEDNEKLSIDETTKLKRRSALYESMAGEMNGLLGGVDAHALGVNDFIDVIRSVKPEDARKNPSTVMMGDVAFLSLVNKAGHNEGDEFLRIIGEELANIKKDEIVSKPDFSRHGGDEITGIFRVDKQTADRITKKIGERISKINDSGRITILNRFGLPPTLDIGTAELSEAIAVFKSFLDTQDSEERAEFIERLQEDGAAKELENIWMEIADRRSFTNKTEARIRLLLKLKKQHPEIYEQTISFLRKGSDEIKDIELENILSNGMNNEEKIKKEIADFIEQRQEAALSMMNGYKSRLRKKINHLL